MESSELRRLLNEGIQAARAGERPLARDRLLRVLDADARSEPAWLWLSAVLDEPGEQLLALERVLAINPTHPQALAGAQALRRQLGRDEAARQPPLDLPLRTPTEMAEPAAASSAIILQPQSYSPEPTPGATAIEVLPPMDSSGVLFDTLLAEDDPYQCAYCGRQTHPDDERCRHCGRDLLVPGPWRGGGYMYLGLLLTGVQLQWSLVQALAAYLVGSYPRAASALPLFSLWTGNLLAPAIVRALAWAVVVLMLLSDYDRGYGVAALVAVVDLAWAAIGFNLGWLASFESEVNGGLAVVILLIGLMAVISQAQSRLRQRVVPDRNLDGALMFHRRALVYSRQGKWALAALHWRRAISRSPSEPIYYKALGNANARLGRYAEAVRAFKSGAEVAPSDREFTRLIEMVRAHARSS
jgi:tetratricopeptide (TPR) repeat protein